MRLTISLRVPSMNERDKWHWSKRNGEMKKWKTYIHALAGHRIAPAYKMRVIITSYRRSLIRDRANLVGGCKGLVDAMTATGLIHDDSDEWVAIEYRQEQSSRDQRTTIEVSPCQPQQEESKE